MTTTAAPRADTETSELIHYRVEDGIGVIEMDNPPANTYTYEMNLQLDAAILRARMDDDVHVIFTADPGNRSTAAQDFIVRMGCNHKETLHDELVYR